MSKTTQIREGQYGDVMPDMSEEEFAALKRSIEEDGLRHPIEITPDGTILDGHHRFKACRELGIGPDTVVVEDATIEQAIRANLTRRNLSDGSKREVVERYLEKNYDGERTQKAIAEELGVSEATVSRAMERISPKEFTREDKRQQASEYLDEHPDASAREVARNIEADVSHPTVRKWMDEWSTPEEEDEPTETDDQGDESTESDTTEKQDTSDDGVEELDYPDEIRQWTHSHKPTGAVYGAKADFDVYPLVQVILSEGEDGWEVRVDGPGPTDPAVVCSGREYSLAADAMLGYLDSTKPDAARRSIDTEETRPDETTTGADMIDKSSDPSTQQDATTDGGDESDPSDAEPEESAEEATADGGVGAKPPEDWSPTSDRVEELEEENERLEERVEELEDENDRLEAEVADADDSSAEEVLSLLGDIVEAVNDKDSQKVHNLAEKAERKFAL